MKDRGTVYSMQMYMARGNVVYGMKWMLVSISESSKPVEAREVTLMWTITDRTFIVKIHI